VPLLVVLTHRPEFQSRWSGQGHVGALNLSKLTRTQSAAMVAALTGGKALPGPLLEQILGRTDGVPLFVEELTKSVLESGVLAVGIPTSLHDSLMARLDRLSSVRRVAQIGAVIGREFSYLLVRAVSRLPEDALQNALGELVVSELVFQRGTPPDAVYIFKHALVQDAAQSSLLRSSRQQLHA
jgi:predicted ATPase